MFNFFNKRLLRLFGYVEHHIKPDFVDFPCTEPVRVKVPYRLTVHRRGIAVLITTKDKIGCWLPIELRRLIWLTGRQKLTAGKKTSD